jgi:D-threo-aldose 1-dehydrogenase
MLKLSANDYRPLGKTGLRVPPIVFGCSALGNLYQVVPDVAKLEIVSEWFEHVSPPVFIDTAGKYGAGLALEVLGESLAKFEIPPEDVLISSKLGWKRVPLNSPEPTFEPGLWIDVQHDAVQQISYDGILECWEESCRLLGNDYKPRLVSVHDPDEYLAAAASPADRRRRFDDVIGAYRALHDLKQKAEVKGIGVGAKNWHVIREIADVVALDWVMLAGSLTVMQHPPDLLDFIAQLAAADVAIINSAVFHSGFLVGGKYFDYRAVSADHDADRPLFAWRKSFVALCEAHGISPLHACVRFGLSTPGVVAVALNTSQADRIRENVAAVAEPVPPQFWGSLKEEGLLEESYPYV